jgi:hypothetical protein
MAVECQSFVDRGFMRVSGLTPNGDTVVTREVDGMPTVLLRGGALNITTGGFSLDDTEAPLGVPLTYRAVVSGITTTDRVIQQNLMPTPTFTHGVQGWTAGSVNRTLSVVADATAHSASVGFVTGDGTATSRVIAKGKTSALAVASDPYLFTGRFKFVTPGLRTWADVKAVGTWLQVRTAYATWLIARGTQSTVPGDYLQLWLSIVNPVTSADYITPVQVRLGTEGMVNTWIDFSALFTVPAGGIPATAEVRLSHGTTAKEYAVQWYLDEFGITPGIQRQHSTLYWFDGDTTVPADATEYQFGPGWTAAAGTASITWAGTAGNSISTFYGPVGLQGTTAGCQMDASDTSLALPCEPVLLSDPVNVNMVSWVGLIHIDALTHPSKQTVHQIINRAAPVAISQVRGWETGTITVLTMTSQHRALLLTVIRSGRVLLLRNPVPEYPENNWFLALGDITEDRPVPNQRVTVREWTMPFVRVERPTGLIEASSGRTWQQVKDSGTWDNLRNTTPDWLGVLIAESVG